MDTVNRVRIRLASIGITSIVDAQWASTGRVALQLFGFGFFLWLPAAWRLRSWWTTGSSSTEDQELERIRLEVAALNLAQGDGSAVLPPPPGLGLQMDPSTSSAANPSLLGALRGFLSAGADSRVLPHAAGPKQLPTPLQAKEDYAIVPVILESLTDLSKGGQTTWSVQFWEWIGQMEKDIWIGSHLLAIFLANGYTGDGKGEQADAARLSAA